MDSGVAGLRPVITTAVGARTVEPGERGRVL